MANNDNPDNAVVIIADDGTVYKLDESYWKKEELQIENPGAVGIVRELKEFGSVVAFLKRDFAAGFGTCCTVLNLGALKRG